MNSLNLTITIVGGGSSAHTLIPLLSSSGHTVNIMTRKPEQWSNHIELQYQSTDGEVLKRFHGELNKISDNSEEVIPEADVIILCMPVSKYRTVLHQIAPHIKRDKRVYVGTVYGQAGFNWMVDEIKKPFQLNEVVTFSFGLIPWICRIQEYGKVGITYGVKPINIAAVEPPSFFEFLNETIFKKVCVDWFGKGAFQQANKFISLTLSVDNQIIHPARCYGLFKKYGGEWKAEADIPYFYDDFDQFSADVLKKLDADYSKIRNQIKAMYPEIDFPFMLDYLTQDRVTNETEELTVLESFLTSDTLGAIRTPAIQTKKGTWKIDTDHRFFTDDIHYGVCIAKWIADLLTLEVPMIDEIIHWAQELRDEKLMDGRTLLLESEDLKGKFKSGIPYYYGFRTIDDIVD